MSRVLNKIIDKINKNHIIMVLVLMFLFIIPINVKAEVKDYSKFNWDEFYAKRKNYWTSLCDDSISPDGECNDPILYYQKTFFIKLYQLLAEYQKKGIYISDDVILATAFYELFPNYGGNPEQMIKYKNIYSKDEEKNSRPAIKISDNYNINNLDSDDQTDLESQAADLSTEEDTIKMLLGSAVAYYTYCYGDYGDPITVTLEDGSVHKTCPENSKMTRIIQRGLGVNKETCAVNLSATTQTPGNELGYTDYFVSRITHEYNLPFGVSILGDYKEDDYYTECESRKDTYPGGTYYMYVDQTNKPTPHVSYTKFFDFLKTSRYFDNRLHLQSEYDSILKAAGVSCLTSSVCTDSLEAAGAYDLYEEQLEHVRLRFIKNIISILNTQGMDISYDGYGTISYSSVEATTAERSAYYWPIGGSEITEENGIKFAKGTPTKVMSDVISYFGSRKNPVTKESEIHYGIDISTEDSVTNVVAAYNGIVISVVDNCTVGDYTCNEGYGNTVIISHQNGDYTVYAHLSSVDPQIQVATSVLTGELIGLAGTTGLTQKSILTYELRVGGNNVTNAIDPITATPAGKNSPPNVDDLRPTGFTASGYAARSPKFEGTRLTKAEFTGLLNKYCASNPKNVAAELCNNAELVYDKSQEVNVNPELVIVRAIAEGNSPGIVKHNYWGMGCVNGGGVAACINYSSLEDGISGFGKNVSKYNNLAEMMSKYAYIGRNWYNPGSWANGGCKYLPLIKEYMSPQRQSETEAICSKTTECASNNTGDCTPTTQEDQDAYASWQVSKNMGPKFHNVFGT